MKKTLEIVVIPQVIHIIHTKRGGKCGLFCVKKEQTFCRDRLKLKKCRKRTDKY